MTRGPSLPARIQNAVAAVLREYDAIDARIERGEPRGNGNAAYKALAALIEEIGLGPMRDGDPDELTALTDVQRAAMIALTSSRWIPIETVAKVPPHWRRRRWLGLAPPGLLERRWGEKWPANLDEALAAIPDEQRVEAGIELLLSSRRSFDTKRWVDELPKLAPHALAYAQKTLPELPRCQTRIDTCPPLAAIALFTVFSASGAVVPSGADERFPLSYRLEGEPLTNRVSTRFLVDHLRAVAESRRDVVLTGALRRTQEGGKYHATVHLLEHCGPLPNATRAVERYLAKAKGQRMTGHEKSVISELARRMKALVATSGVVTAKRPKMALAKAKAKSR